MTKLVEKIHFKAKCDVCGNDANRIINLSYICSNCLNQMFEQIADAIREV